MKRFDGRVALVTGGAHGIGRAVVQGLLAEGARVVAADVEEGPLQETVAELAPRGDSLRAVAGDISRRDDVHRMVTACVETFGRLDVLVANAAVTDAQPLLDITDSRWQRVLDVNVTGTFYCLQEAARVMAPQGGGAIVVTASTNAFWVESHLGAYNTSKGGVIALVRSAAIDLAPLGIRVNAVEPGVVRTRFASFVVDNPAESAWYLKKIPLNRFAEPVDVAKAILFLASSDAGYITGQALILDGGMTLGLTFESPPRDSGEAGLIPGR
jgi:NAD(P)-dependent dehydrogenase (short-subunit alcohol dehydrogenase family)